MASSSRPRRYAEGTSVSVASSRAELERLLVTAGATQRMMAFDDAKARARVQFFLRGRMLRFDLQLPAATERGAEAETRRRWRALVLILKGKLESADGTVETFEQAFMAHTVMPDGQTAGEAALPMIEDAYRTGRAPTTLLALPAPQTGGPRG